MSTRVARNGGHHTSMPPRGPADRPCGAHKYTGYVASLQRKTGSHAAVAVPRAALEPSQLDQPISDGLVDLGAQAARKLAEIGVKSYRDLLMNLPRRYEDRRLLPDFAGLEDGVTATVTGQVMSRSVARSRRGLTVLRASMSDRNGKRLTAVWFNQPWLEKQLYPGQRLIVSGKVKRQGAAVSLTVSGHEVDDDTDSLSFGRIVGVYSTTQGLSQAYVRRAVRRLLDALETVPDHLQRSLLERHRLIALDQAWRQAHFPADEGELQAAMRRLKFDDFLFFELAVLRSRDPNRAGRSFVLEASTLAAFESVLPFEPTGAQRRAMGEILSDMAAPKQMARLLQGDVGSGKTAVAAAAIHVAVANGAQAALMAPTDILARQHLRNLQGFLYPLNVRTELLTGTMSAGERDGVKRRLASQEVDVVVGTHALIQEGVTFRDLGLAVIDEEHRFGVSQRRALVKGATDVLVMSATPIPRSLALTLYGDLDLTVIDELPPGREPVKTRLVNAAKRREVYGFAAEQVAEGRQVYVVTPLIEQSEALDEVVATTDLVDDLRLIMPGSCRIEMLHGRMSAPEKDAVMNRFRAHESDVLVSTTVIEVGVDVPNATLMIIENAERFGLSQLHQLRGRVGRSSLASWCVLVAGDRSRKTQKRLEVLVKNADGFAIAELDLELRGPGDLRGTRQSGLPELTVGDLVSDVEVIEEARGLAMQMLSADPDLASTWARRLRDELRRRSSKVMVREVI